MPEGREQAATRRTVTAKAVNSLVRALGEIGCDAHKPLYAAGFDGSPAASGPHFDHEVDRERFVRFSRISLRALNSYAAHREGQRPTPLADFWLMYSCMLSLPTLGRAIRTASAIHRLINDGQGYLDIEVSGPIARVYFHNMRREYIGDDLRSMYGLSSFHRFFSWLIGEKILVSTSAHSTAAPLSLENYIMDYSGDNDRFAHELIFSADYLERPIVRQSRDVDALGRNFPFDIFAHDDESRSYSYRVRSILNSHLIEGRIIPDLPTTASMLSLSPATLRRRLELEGSSLLDIRAECRHDLAKTLLRDSRMSIEQISERVQFSDITAFRRAFRNNVGMTPSEYRSKSSQ